MVFPFVMGYCMMAKSDVLGGGETHLKIIPFIDCS
jgi:hypothetical protein